MNCSGYLRGLFASFVAGGVVLAGGATAQAQDLAIHYPHTGVTEIVENPDFDLSDYAPEAITVLEPRRGGSITWNIVYLDVNNTTGVGFDDPTRGATRRQTLEDVFTYFNTILDHSAVTIDVEVSESQTDGSGALASAGTFYFLSAGFQGGLALEHITTGTDPSAGAVDMVITVDFGYSWNDDSGSPASGEFDLASVLTHEVMHGLGFSALTRSDGESSIRDGSNNNTDARSFFSELMETGNGNALFDSGGVFTGNTSWLTGSDNGLVSVGANATAELGSNPQLFTPGSFQTGSSLSHWDTAEAGGVSVMQPSIPPQTERRALLPFEEQFLKDMGYSIVEVSAVDSWQIFD